MSSLNKKKPFSILYAACNIKREQISRSGTVTAEQNIAKNTFDGLLTGHVHKDDRAKLKRKPGNAWKQIFGAAKNDDPFEEAMNEIQSRSI